MLVLKPLTQSTWMICIRNILALVEECCLIPSSQCECKNSEETERTWSQLLIIFSNSLPKIFSSIMGWNNFSELQFVLLGLGMMINIKFLKCLDQCLSLMHKLATLTILLAGKSSQRGDPAEFLGIFWNVFLQYISLKFVISYSSVCNGIHFMPSQTNVQLVFCDTNQSQLLWWASLQFTTLLLFQGRDPYKNSDYNLYNINTFTSHYITIWWSKFSVKNQLRSKLCVRVLQI